MPDIMDFIEKYSKEIQIKFSILSKKEKRILAIMCLERQLKAYEKFALGKNWNRANEYREMFDICWNSILNDKNVDESIWEFHENIKPEIVNKIIDEYKEQEFCYANIFSTNVMEFLENLLDDNGNEIGFLLLNLDFIICFLNNNKDTYVIEEYENDELIMFEIKMQQLDEMKLKKIVCLNDVKKWIDECKSLI